MLNFKSNENHKPKVTKEEVKEFFEIFEHPQMFALGLMGVAAIVGLGFSIHGIIDSYLHPYEALPSPDIAAVTESVDGARQVLDCKDFSYQGQKNSVLRIVTDDGTELYMDSRDAKVFVGEDAHNKANEYVELLNQSIESGYTDDTSLQDMMLDTEVLDVYGDDNNTKSL